MSKNVYIPANAFPLELNEREQAILRSIIHLYLINAKPVGSRSLSKYLERELKLSPATIRNVMSDLEEKEYIKHPHTSAGRIPTDKGYRVYVDSLMTPQDLSEKDLETVKCSVETEASDTILKGATKVIGLISKYLGLAEIPHLYNLIVQKIELIQLSSNRLLVVIALESNIIRTVTLETEFDMHKDNLDEISIYINEKISAKKLGFIKENFSEMIKDFGSSDAPLVRLFIDSVDKIFQLYQEKDRIHIAGTQNLLYLPEFDDLERVRSVIELVENEDVIIHILDSKENQDSDINIMIGKEMQNELLEDYSFVSTKYFIGSAIGSIGLIGPKRMNYAKVIPLVQYVSEMITKKTR